MRTRRKRNPYVPVKKIGNGRYLNPDGYVLVWVKRGEWEFEHRLVAQRALGRKLKPGEQVHHVYGDKLDNKRLVICSEEYHLDLHKRQKAKYGQWHLPKPEMLEDVVEVLDEEEGWSNGTLSSIRHLLQGGKDVSADT